MALKPSPSAPRGVDVPSYAADIATRLGERLPDLVADIAKLVSDEIEDLRDGALTELLYAGAEANVTTLLQALRCGIAMDHVGAPTAALEHARGLAQHGVAGQALVRAYRLGQRYMTEAVFAELQTIDMTEQARFTVLEGITATLFSYVDWVYRTGGRRLRRGAGTVVGHPQQHPGCAGTRGVDGPNADRRRRGQRSDSLPVAMASSGAGDVVSLGGRRRRTGSLAKPGRRQLGAATNASGAPLFIPTDRTSGWAWLPYRSAPAEQWSRFGVYCRSAPMRRV